MDIAQHNSRGEMPADVRSRAHPSEAGPDHMKHEARSSKHEANPKSPMTQTGTSQWANGQRPRGTIHSPPLPSVAQLHCVWNIGISSLELVSDFGFRVSDFGAGGGRLAGGGEVGSWR